MTHFPSQLRPMIVRTSFVFLGTVAILLVTFCETHAQRGLTATNAARVGLEPVWSKAIMTGIGGKISGLTVYVSPNRSYQGSEVVDRFGRRAYFSERDVRATRSGYDQTLRMTELKEAQLAAKGLQPQTEIKSIPEVTVYVRSNFGTLTAIDGETGHEKWTAQAGKAGYPSFAAAASDDYVVVLSSLSIYLLDAHTGQVLESRKSEFLPSATPTIDGNLIYVPTSKGVVHVFSTEDLGRKAFTLGSSGGIDSPVTIGSTTVSWATSQGYMNVANAGRPGKKYRFQSLDRISASPAYMDKMLFATSLDGFAYAISEDSGETNWSFSAGGPVREAPLAIDGNVYVTTIDGQMTSIDAATGKANWLASGVERFVAVSDSRLYCATAGHDLTVLDVATGGRIGTVPISREGLPFVNTNTDRVYLLSGRGVLQCFREQGRRWPIARVPARGAEVVEEVVEETPASKADEVPSAEQPSTEEDTDDSGSDDDMSDDSGFDDSGFDDSGFDDGDDESLDEGMEDDGDPFGDDAGFGDEGGDESDEDNLFG